MRLETLLKRYEAEYLPQIIDQATQRSRIKNLLSNLPNIEVESIDYATLSNYRAIREKELSPGSINRELGVLSAAITWGNRKGITEHSVRIPIVREQPKTVCLDSAGVRRLIEAAGSVRLRATLRLLFLTGQRKDAILKLKRNQIVDGVIEFERATGRMVERRKRRARTPVTSGIAGVLNELEGNFGRTEYVIPGDRGFGWYKKAERDFKALAQSLGLAITMHTLRHTAATIAIANGVPLYEVSRFLGHCSVAVTQSVYIHNSPKTIEAAVKSLEGVL